VTELVVSVPAKRVSAWSVETNPKYARAWLASLSPVDNSESARELYQSLFALNRMDLDAAQRFELMGLYRVPLQEAVASFQPLFSRVSFPMPVKLRQLAEFICQLHLEMAHGYKLCVQDISKHWFPWRRRQLLAPCTERALRHLGEVMLQSYRSYLPHPAGVWRDAHGLYRFAEHYGREKETVKIEDEGGITGVSVSQRYRRLLMLGIANPYQMPFNECQTVYRFLGRWIEQVGLDRMVMRADSTGCFLIDPTTDAPPPALGRAVSSTNTDLRVLDASELVRTLHVFLRRLERGEAAADLQLGVDCLDSACHDMLQRLHRGYAQTTSRRHSRIKRHETVSVCAGVAAMHFFVSDLKPLTGAGVGADAPFRLDDVSAALEKNDEAYVALDEPHDAPAPVRSDTYRIDRWQVHDVSPQGLLLSQDGEPSVRFRVGDALGVQRSNTVGQWSVGIVRWFRAQGTKGVEVGVELISPDAAPVSLRAAGDSEAVAAPALMLPPVEAAHRPASVLAPRGVLLVGKDFFLTARDRTVRRVRILDAIERTGSIEQVIVGNVID